MDKKAHLPFPEVRRYERTIKERLAAGEIFRHFEGRFEVATMRKEQGSIVMKGFTGTHILNFDSSDARRIEIHWKGFRDESDKARTRSRGNARR